MHCVWGEQAAMSTNMDGPDSLIEDVLNLPVEDLYTLLQTIMDRLKPLAALVTGGVVETQERMYDVTLTGVNEARKIPSIKAVRAAGGSDPVTGTFRIGLRVAKDMVEEVAAGLATRPILTKVPYYEAERAIQVLQAEGCSAILS